MCWNGEAGRVMTEKRTGEEGRGRECEGVILLWPVCVAVARSRAHKGSRVLYHGPEIVSFAVIYASFSLDLL